MMSMGDIKIAQDPVEYPRADYAWYVVFVLFLAYVVSFMDRQILSLLVEPIKEDLQLTDTMISLLHGFAFAIFYTVLGIPIGRLADSHNRKKIIIVGITLWSLMTSLCGFAINAMMLFTTRIGVAVGEATLSPSAYSMISDYFPRDKRGRALSYYSLGIFAGAGAAYIFGGLISSFAAETVAKDIAIIGTMKAWQLTFILTGLPGLLVVALMFSVREPVRRERLHSNEGSIPLAETFSFIRSKWVVYCSLFVATGLIVLANYGLLLWVPAYFIRVYDYTPRQVGLSFGTILLTVGTGGLIISGWVADLWFRKGRHTAHLDMTIIATSLAIIPAITLFFVDTATGSMTCIAFILFFLAVHTGLVPAALQLITPNEFRGQITAIYLLVISLIGLGIGPTAVALITDHYFGDPLQVGNSIAITLCLSIFFGISIFIMGHHAYDKRQRELEDLI